MRSGQLALTAPWGLRGLILCLKSETKWKGEHSLLWGGEEVEGRGDGMGLLRSHTHLTLLTRLLRVYLCLGKEETGFTHV